MAWLGDGGSGGKPASGGGTGGGLRVGGYVAPTNSKGGAVRFNSPTKWQGSGDGNLPQPMNAQEQRISDSFMSLPAAQRNQSLNDLNTKAQAGDAASARKLQYLVPQHNDNVPAVQQFAPAPTFSNGILNGASDLATGMAKGIADPIIRGGKALTSLQNTGQLGESGKQFAADALNTGLLAVGGGEVAGEKAAALGVRALKGAATGAAVGGVGAGTEAAAGNQSAGDILKSTVMGAAGGGVIGAGGGVLTGIFKAGAAKSLAKAQAVAAAQKVTDDAAQKTADDAAYAASGTGLPAGEKPLALPAGAPKPLGNESTTTIPGTPGTPATPATIPLADGEYAQRFNALSKSYDSQTKAAAQIPGPLKQRIVLENIDQTHQAALDQLNHEAANGKVNPDAAPATPGTPDQTVPSGFTMGDTAIEGGKEATAKEQQTSDLQTRIAQIDQTIQRAATTGTQHSPDQLRALLRERVAAQDVLQGKRTFESVYSPTAPTPGAAPSIGEAPATAPGGEGPTPPPIGSPEASPRIAFDYNGAGGADHTAVPMNELHPDARNLFQETAPVVAGDTKAPVLNRGFVSNAYHAMANKLQRVGGQLAPENVSKLDNIELSDRPADAPPITKEDAAAQVQKVAATIADPKQRDIFLKTVDQMKANSDTRYAGDVHGLGREMGYRQNYVPHIYEHDNMADDPHAGGGTPGYTKGRIIATRSEAAGLAKETNPDGSLKYPNLQLKGNALEASVAATRSAAYEHSNQALAKGIQEAHPGVQIGNKVTGGYQQLNGTNLAAPREVANIYNPRLQVPGQKPSLPVRVYDKANTGLKTSILGGGTFHGVTTAGTVAGQQTMRAITNPADWGKMIGQNLKVIAGTFSKGAHDSNMAVAEQTGLTDFSRKAGTTLDYNGKVDTARTHIPVISDIHDAVFQRQIPEAKLMIMEQSMQRKFPGMDFHNPTPEQAAYGRQVASAVNNIGGINRAVEGLTPNQAKMIGRFVLAPDYTEGKFRTMFNGVTNWTGPKGNIARQAIVGKSVLFALPGLVALTAAGKLDWSDPKAVSSAVTSQILDPSVPTGEMGPPTKSNPGGTPLAAHLPTTFVSEIGKIIAPVVAHIQDPTGNPDALSGATSYVTNRASAILGTGARLVQNKDFYGNPIIGGTDKNGNPNGIGQDALNVASQVGPIPAVQGIKFGTGQESALDAGLNTAGMRVSNDTSSAQSGHSASVTKMYNAFTPALTQKTAIAKQVTTLISKNQVNQAHRVAQAWNNKLESFARDYPANMDATAKAAWDTKWKSLIVKSSSRADATRRNDAKQNNALLK